LENPNESIAGNIPIALRKSDGHKHDLLLEPLKEVRQRGMAGKLGASSTKHSYKGLFVASKISQLLANKVLKSLQLRSLSLLYLRLILHCGVMGSARVFQIFLEALIFRG
jgi:hypothetical protein